MPCHPKFSQKTVKTHLSQPKGKVGIIASGGKKSQSTKDVTNFLEVALAVAWQSLCSNLCLPIPDTLLFLYVLLHCLLIYFNLMIMVDGIKYRWQ